MSGIDLATALALAGTAVGTVGVIQQGEAAASQAKFQAEQASRQAEIERQKADRARAAGRQREEDFRRNQALLMARRRAILGASGVQTDTGAPLLTSQDFASEVELEAQRLRSNALTTSTRLDQAATLQADQAGLFRSAAGSARVGGLVRGGALLLTGVGKALA